jgi:O-antigen/teichoic acid export membrane protein
MNYKTTFLYQKLMSSDVGRRMAVGAFWSFTGTALAKFLVLVAGIFCARFLGKQGYGEFGMVRSTISLFVTIGFAGLGLTATKYISEYRNTAKERIGSIIYLTRGFALLMGILITTIVLLISPYLASDVLEVPHLVDDLRVGALLLFVTVINGAQVGVLSGFEDFRSIALNTLWGSIAECSFMLLGAWFYGVFGAVLGYGVGFAVLYLFNRFSINRRLTLEGISVSSSNFNKTDLSLLYKFSLPAALSSIMVVPTYWIVRSMLVCHNGFEELAIYEVADHWKIIILFIPSAISQVVLPILSSSLGDGKDKFWKILKMNIFLNAGGALVLALLISLSSSYIMDLYGNGYDDTSTLIILAISTIFNSIATVVGLSIYSRAKMWTGATFNFLWAMMVVGFSYWFISINLGAVGVALSILAAYVIHSMLQLIYVSRISR